MVKNSTRCTKIYYEWRDSVYKRDKYKCQHCGVDKKLNAHHIVPWDESVDLRYDINNGLTLCVGCHARHHKNYTHFKKGNIPWNKGLKNISIGWPKGRKQTEEHTKKLNLFKKNISSWNKGTPMREETKEIIRKKLSGKTWRIDKETGKRKWILT